MFNHMVEYLNEEKLRAILKAVSDPTRRAISTVLVQEGPTRVTDLAAHHSISLNAVSRHIKILESAGLAVRRTHGRNHLLEANLGPVNEIDKWFQSLRSIWELRLERLSEILEEEK